MEERKIFTLTQLNTAFEKHVWDHFSSKTFWITAELIKVNQKNGHFYLELADSEKEQTTARSFATIWAGVYAQIAAEVGYKEIQGILQAGNKILMNVKIEYHKVYGLSLRVQNIDPNYSFGEIERKRQEVIKRLKKEGIFDNQRKLNLPVIIKRIALIGSPGTSGFRDFLNELFNNHEFNRFAVKEFPVRVQGDAAVDDIVSAIREANHYDAEVIVILRGGGSKMDLALFDDYRIAKEICLSRLPVITGIGHETDEVVADLVARQKQITPTAVAVHIHYAIKSFVEIMRDMHDKTLQMSLTLLGDSKEEFTMYSNYLSHHTRELIHHWRNVFKDKEYEVLQKSRTLLYANKDQLSLLRHKTSSLLQNWVHGETNELNRLVDRLSSYGVRAIDNERELVLKQLLAHIEIHSQQSIDRERIVLNNQEELLTLLNPVKILASGYTISTVGDEDVKDVTVQAGDEMKTLSEKQLITSKIIEVKEINHGD